MLAAQACCAQPCCARTARRVECAFTPRATKAARPCARCSHGCAKPTACRVACRGRCVSAAAPVTPAAAQAKAGVRGAGDVRSSVDSRAVFSRAAACSKRCAADACPASGWHRAALLHLRPAQWRRLKGLTAGAMRSCGARTEKREATKPQQPAKAASAPEGGAQAPSLARLLPPCVSRRSRRCFKTPRTAPGRCDANAMLPEGKERTARVEARPGGCKTPATSELPQRVTTASSEGGRALRDSDCPRRAACSCWSRPARTPETRSVRGCTHCCSAVHARAGSGKDDGA